jgi:hypothetical protein
MIDLTKEHMSSAIAGEQRAPKRRRTEDEPVIAGFSRSAMDMPSINTEINTVQRDTDHSPTTKSERAPPVQPRPDINSGPAPTVPISDAAVTGAPIEHTEKALTNSEKPKEEMQETVDEEDDEDEDEEMIDIWDEQGMVKVELCLEAAFDEVDGKFTCKMCE